MRSRLLWIACFALAIAPASSAQQQQVDVRRVELGIALAKQGHLDDALRQFTLVLSQNSSNVAALNNAANVHALRNRLDRAAELYERALEAEPDDGGIHLNLALLLHRLNQGTASAHHMEEGLRLVGDIEHAYYMLGLSGSAGNGASRASEAERLSDQEIEDLLRRALAAIPPRESEPEEDSQSDERQVEARPIEEEQRVGSRRTSTRAGADEQITDRFYWKSADGTN